MENRDRTARDIGRYVSGKVYPLQKSYLKAGVGGSEVRATLARLRHLDGSGPSSWMMVGCELFSGLPEFGISAADDERAIRTIISALSLYAVHQQSKMLPMALELTAESEEDLKRSGRFGRACRRCANLDPEGEKGITRRLAAIEAASDFDGIEYCIRALVLLLKAKDISLDYYALAHDLYLVQFDDRRDSVFIQWSRDYYAFRPKGEKGQEQRVEN